MPLLTKLIQFSTTQLFSNGVYTNEKQFVNTKNPCIFHLEISGKLVKEEQFSNILYILINLDIDDSLHLEISGKTNKDEQFLNILFISLTLETFHLEISGKENKDEQSLNILFIFSTLETSHLEISGKVAKDEQF